VPHLVTQDLVQYYDSWFLSIESGTKNSNRVYVSEEPKQIPNSSVEQQGTSMRKIKLTTLSVENSFNNVCVSIINSDKRVLFDQNIVFRPPQLVEQDSDTWITLLHDFHRQTLPELLHNSLRDSGLSRRMIDFISFSIVRGRYNARVELGRRIVKNFAGGDIPILEVDHLEGHIISAMFCDEPPQFPFISLIVAGGNSNLYLAQSFGNYILLGTHERSPKNKYGHGRAVGAVLDKCAVLLGLARANQPDGAIEIDRLSQRKQFASYHSFAPLDKLNNENGYDFRFDLMYELVEELMGSELSTDYSEYLAVSVQEALMRVLIRKTFAASDMYNVPNIVICGGVSANSRLRQLATDQAIEQRKKVFLPPMKVCTDNSLMIGLLGLMTKGIRFGSH
jgi:N6-L-threonylcarbamoyladenine synthase